MSVQLPPNSTGSVIETRTVAGRERQLVALAEPPRPAPTRTGAGLPGRVRATPHEMKGED